MSTKQASTPSYNLFSRIWEYPVVHNTLLGAGQRWGEYYNNVKSYNPHSKMVLETAEAYGTQLASTYWAKLNQYGNQPLVGNLINKVDSFGCQQLDKIEDVCNKLKTTSPTKVIHSVEHAIAGTKVESVLITAVEMADLAVETLLPAGSDNTAASESTENPGNANNEEGASSSKETELVKVTIPVLLKLRDRLSKKGVLQIPYNTYHSAKELALTLPQLSIYVNTLSSLLDYVSVTYSKGVYLPAAVYEHVMGSVRILSRTFETLANLFKNFDTVEARTSLVELAKILSASKDNVAKAIHDFHLTEKLKQEGTVILYHTGKALLHPIETGYTFISHADVNAIKQVLSSLEATIQPLMESLVGNSKAKLI